MLKPVVNFYSADTSYIVPLKTRLRTFIPAIFKKEGRSWNQLDIIICSDDYLLGLNKQHLNHDYYTDIITFDLSSPEMTGVAELYISIERVKENSKAAKTSIYNELFRVIFHGVLHLCGYKDSTKKLKEAIHAKEDFYLSLWKRST